MVDNKDSGEAEATLDAVSAIIATRAGSIAPLADAEVKGFFFKVRTVTAEPKVDSSNLASESYGCSIICFIEYDMQPNSTLLKLVCLHFMGSFRFIYEIGSHYINQTSLNSLCSQSRHRTYGNLSASVFGVLILQIHTIKLSLLLGFKPQLYYFHLHGLLLKNPFFSLVKQDQNYFTLLWILNEDE